MYKPISSATDTDHLCTGFDCDCVRRQREFTINKNQKVKYHLRFMLRDVFGFAEYQEKTTSGLGYKLTLMRNNDESVLNKANATNNAKIKVNGTEWYVTHYTPPILQQAILSKQIFCKVPTATQNVERSVFMKEVVTRNVWTF